MSHKNFSIIEKMDRLTGKTVAHNFVNGRLWQCKKCGRFLSKETKYCPVCSVPENR